MNRLQESEQRQSGGRVRRRCFGLVLLLTLSLLVYPTAAVASDFQPPDNGGPDSSQGSGTR